MDLVWRKSTRSQPTGGNCVEVATTPTKRYVRDSKNPGGPHLVFPVGATTAFLAAVKTDQLG